MKKKNLDYIIALPVFHNIDNCVCTRVKNSIIALPVYNNIDDCICTCAFLPSELSDFEPQLRHLLPGDSEVFNLHAIHLKRVNFRISGSINPQ